MPTLKQFGIAWKLSILTTPNDDGEQTLITAFSNAWQPEPLEIQFDVYQTTQSAFWYADIAIYNLNDPTTQIVLKQGMFVKLEAGFQNQPYGVIFEGLLFQPMWERCDGVDYKLTLHCMIGLVEETNNFVAFNVAGGITQRQLIAKMAAACINPLNIEAIDDLSATKSSRGEVVFGQPSLFLEQIAADNELNFWISNVGLNIRNLLQAQDNIPTITYSPTTGLVGTPQQTQDGVALRVLLDPRATLATQIRLTPNVVIAQLPRVQNTYPTILDRDGLYVIGGVRHVGDSRGNVWFTEITAYTYIGSRLALLNP